MRWTFDKRSSKCVSIEKSATLGRSHDTVLVGSGKDTIQILGGVVGSVEHMWVAVPLALPTGDIPAFVGPELVDGLVDTARFHQPKIVLTSPNMIAAELPPHSDGSERVVISFFNVAQRDCGMQAAGTIQGAPVKLTEWVYPKGALARTFHCEKVCEAHIDFKHANAADEVCADERILTDQFHLLGIEKPSGFQVVVYGSLQRDVDRTGAFTQGKCDKEVPPSKRRRPGLHAVPKIYASIVVKKCK